MNVETWLHDTKATSARAKTSRSRSGRAFGSQEGLLECLFLWTPHMQVQKPRWLTVCCLRPFLVGYSYKAELSNATSYYRTSFTTLLPRKCSFLSIRFSGIHDATGQRAQFKLTTLCIDCNGESTLWVNSGTDVTFIAYLWCYMYTKVVHYSSQHACPGDLHVHVHLPVHPSYH